jgi:hypothetical protein
MATLDKEEAPSGGVNNGNDDDGNGSKSNNMKMKQLEHDHLAHAYLVDARALIELLTMNEDADPSMLLLQSRELRFLRRFLRRQNNNKQKDVDVDDTDSTDFVNYGNGTSTDSDDGDDSSSDSDDSRSDDSDSDNESKADRWVVDESNPYLYSWPPRVEAEHEHDSINTARMQPTTTTADVDVDISATRVQETCTHDHRAITTHAQPQCYDYDYDCVLIGAGAAGIGLAVALVAGGLPRSRLLLVEAQTVGHSFAMWPPFTRFISPSIHSNPYGPLDLNSIDPLSGGSGGGGFDVGAASSSSSPAACLKGEQHPTGLQYRDYLRHVATHWKLPIREHTKVDKVTKVNNVNNANVKEGDDIIFNVQLKQEQQQQSAGTHATLSANISSRFVVWCGGEFTFPRHVQPGPSIHIHAAPPSPSTTSSTSEQEEETTSDFKSRCSITKVVEPVLPRAATATATMIHYSEIGATDDEWQTFATQNTSTTIIPPGVDIPCPSHIVIIGGFESGVDAACALVSQYGATHVTIVEESEWVHGWPVTFADHPSLDGIVPQQVDPSGRLSSNSARRLKDAADSGKITILSGRRFTGQVDVVHKKVPVVGTDSNNGTGESESESQYEYEYEYAVHLETSSKTRSLNVNGGDNKDDESHGHAAPSPSPSSFETVLLVATAPVVLCTGFRPDTGSKSALGTLLGWRGRGERTTGENNEHDSADSSDDEDDDNTDTDNNTTLLQEGPMVSQSCDESTITPGLFCCGPMLRHYIAAENENETTVKQNTNTNDGANEDDPTTMQTMFCQSSRISKKSDETADNRSSTQNVYMDVDSSTETKKPSPPTHALVFCFIYKFRTRFALVAGEILAKLVYLDHVHCTSTSTNVTSTTNTKQHGTPIITTTTRTIIDAQGNLRLARVEEMLEAYKAKGCLVSGDDLLSCVAGCGC